MAMADCWCGSGPSTSGIACEHGGYGHGRHHHHVTGGVVTQLGFLRYTYTGCARLYLSCDTRGIELLPAPRRPLVSRERGHSSLIAGRIGVDYHGAGVLRGRGMRSPPLGCSGRLIAFAFLFGGGGVFLGLNLCEIGSQLAEYRLPLGFGFRQGQGRSLGRSVRFALSVASLPACVSAGLATRLLVSVQLAALVAAASQSLGHGVTFSYLRGVTRQGRGLLHPSGPILAPQTPVCGGASVDSLPHHARPLPDRRRVAACLTYTAARRRRRTRA